MGLDAQSGQLLELRPHGQRQPREYSHARRRRQWFIYTAASMSGGGLVKIDKTPNAEPKFDANEVYFAGDLPKAIGGAVKVNGYLYGTNSQAATSASIYEHRR